jgi:glycine oxidase
VKSWDIVIVGGGVIGLSLAVELRRGGASVMVLEQHQLGREASWAAGGMLADREAGSHPLFRAMAKASAAMYPLWVHRLQDESGMEVDLREQGTIRFLDDDHVPDPAGDPLSPEDLRKLEPEVTYSAPAVFLAERCVDPRLLIDALVKTAKHLEVDIASGAEVTGIEFEADRVSAAVTAKSRYAAGAIVNCAGAWAGQFGPVQIPTVPVKGQMLSVTPTIVRHVVRGNGVYLIPRSSGRLVIGATLEDAGYDKRVEPERIQRMHQAAAVLAPMVGQGKILEDWAGLRPGTPDKLPIMGATLVGGYYVASGHYRDGILLAPVTAKVMAQVIRGEKADFDLAAFSANRFIAQQLSS